MSENEIKKLIMIYKTRLPNHYEVMAEFYNFSHRMRKIRNVHLLHTGFYDRKIFFEFLSQIRVANNQKLIHWEIFHTAAGYAVGSNISTSLSLSYFGATATYKSFLRRTKIPRDSFITNIKQLYQKQLKSCCMLDNNQKGHPMQFQRYGSSNKFVKVTGIAMREYIHHAYDKTQKYDLQGKVKITYVQQPIPSPLGMLQYDTIFDTKDRLPLIFLKIFENTQTLPVYSQDVDFTGYSCKRYSDVIKVVDTLNTMKKCLTGYVITTSEFKFPALHPDKFKSELRNTITKKVHHVRNTLLSKSQKFQQINTEMWNPASKKVTKFIVPPVVPYDEISTRGMGMSLIHLLELVGIVNRTETGEKIVCGDLKMIGRNVIYDLSIGWFIYR